MYKNAMFLTIYPNRQDVHCFGEDTCYSLAFGVPALLMVVSTCVLVAGKALYVMKEPQGNVITSVIGSITVRVGGGARDAVLKF